MNDKVEVCDIPYITNLPVMLKFLITVVFNSRTI